MIMYPSQCVYVNPQIFLLFSFLHFLSLFCKRIKFAFYISRVTFTTHTLYNVFGIPCVWQLQTEFMSPTLIIIDWVLCYVHGFQHPHLETRQFIFITMPDSSLRTTFFVLLNQEVFKILN